MTSCGHNVFFKVSDGPTYLCHVSGIGVRPGVVFSFDNYSFGACFIYHAGMPMNTTTLTITNRDTKENRFGSILMYIIYLAFHLCNMLIICSIDCLYENTPFLDVSFQAAVLAPNASTSALITFYPRAVAKYKEIVPFQINGLSKYLLEIHGEGTELRVSFLTIDFVVVRRGCLVAIATTSQNYENDVFDVC